MEKESECVVGPYARTCADPFATASLMNSVACLAPISYPEAPTTPGLVLLLTGGMEQPVVPKTSMNRG